MRAGADAVEIGLPFTDPMLDGPVIQEAATRALGRGATVRSLLKEIATLRVDVPLIVMTYGNVVARRGNAVFCHELAETGVAGLIAPDTPLDESDDLHAATEASGLELVLLVAPSTPGTRGARGRPEPRVRLCRRHDGRHRAPRDRRAHYGCGPGGDVAAGADRFRHLHPHPGRQVARHSDGAIVASALVAEVLGGASPADLESSVTSFRNTLDRPHAR